MCTLLRVLPQRTSSRAPSLSSHCDYVTCTTLTCVRTYACLYHSTVQSWLKVPEQGTVGSRSHCSPQRVRTNSVFLTSPPPPFTGGRLVRQLEIIYATNERCTIWHVCFYFHYYKRHLYVYTMEYWYSLSVILEIFGRVIEQSVCYWFPVRCRAPKWT